MSSTRPDTTRDSRDLHRIATLSACVRGVEEETRGVSITALNAMLASHAGGDGAVGFRVAATELRRFATVLDEIMRTLLNRISGLVRDTAYRMRQGRVRSLLQAATTLHERAAPPLSVAMRSLMENSAKRLAALEIDERALDMVATRGLRQCDMGLALSRSAMIEAAYGGEHAAVFRQVADQLATAIQVMKSLLQDLRTGLAEAHA